MRAERGFTLLEVIIALAIASAALAVLTLTLSGALDGSGRMAQRAEALMRARSHLDAAMAMSRLPPGTQEGDDGDGYRWVMETREIARLEGGTRPIALYAVDVAIRWGVAGHVELTGRRVMPHVGP